MHIDILSIHITFNNQKKKTRGMSHKEVLQKEKNKIIYIYIADTDNMERDNAKYHKISYVHFGLITQNPEELRKIT